MCQHKFIYPEDTGKNYNPDGITITGRCKCGAIQTSKGRKWAIPICDTFLQYFPYQETQFEPLITLDNPDTKW